MTEGSSIRVSYCRCGRGRCGGGPRRARRGNGRGMALGGGVRLGVGVRVVVLVEELLRLAHRGIVEACGRAIAGLSRSWCRQPCRKSNLRPLLTPLVRFRTLAAFLSEAWGERTMTHALLPSLNNTTFRPRKNLCTPRSSLKHVILALKLFLIVKIFSVRPSRLVPHDVFLPALHFYIRTVIRTMHAWFRTCRAR